MTQPTEAILDRIRKLLNVTTKRGATAGEAENAAAAVRALLTRHNLTLLDLPPEEQPSEEVGEHEVNLEVRRLPEWLWLLASGVARGFDCRFIHFSAPRGLKRWMRKTLPPARYVLIGSEVDTSVAEALLATLRRELTRDADRAIRQRKLAGDDRRNYRRDFLRGAAQAIGERLKHERAEERRTSTRAGEIMVRKGQALQRKLDAMEVKTVETGPITNGIGYRDGHRHGQQIHLGTNGIGTDRRLTLALTGPRG